MALSQLFEGDWFNDPDPIADGSAEEDVGDTGAISRIFSFILPIAIPVRVSAQGRVADSPGPLPASDNGLTGARARGAGSRVWAD